MATAVIVKGTFLTRATKERHEVSKQKEVLVEEYSETKQVQTEMQK